MPTDGNAGGSARRFTVGIVISTSLAVLSANILRFLGILLAVGIPAALVIGAAILALATRRASSTGQGVDFTLQGGGAGAVLLMIVIVVVGMLAYALAQSAITYGVLQVLRSRKAGVGACLSNGLAAMPRVFLANLILFVVTAIVSVLAVQMFRVVALGGGVFVGMVASLVFLAAIAFILVMVWVFVPALVVERLGPLNGFGRSAALTKGHRWGILGLFALVLVANLVVNFISRMLPGIGAPAAGRALDVAAGLFFVALSAVMAAVGYYVLRAEKEGVAIEDVVKVFD